MIIKIHLKCDDDNVLWITHETLPVQVWQAVADSIKDLGGQQFGGTGSTQYHRKMEGKPTQAHLRGWGEQLAGRIKLRYPADKVDVSVEWPGYSVDLDLSKGMRRRRKGASVAVPATIGVAERHAQLDAQVSNGELTYKAAWYLLKEYIDANGQRDEADGRSAPAGDQT